MKNVTALLSGICIGCIFVACQENATEHEAPVDSTTDRITVVQDSMPSEQSPISAPTIYENDRFRQVTVTRISADSANVKGEGQIFEASFGWVVEDGHNELSQGYATTSAGAPEWGSFNFNVPAKPARENTSLTLILFETSANDGSRVHELIIPIPSL